ncbi:MAG: hypothetical protein ACTSYU_00260 [Promethearchaeota archaeon]
MIPLEFYFISSLDFPLLINTYGRPQSSKPYLIPSKVEITKDTAYEVKFTIRYPRGQLHGIIHDCRGFYCSCQSTMRLEMFKPLHRQTIPYFCYLSLTRLLCENLTISIVQYFGIMG